MQRRRRASTCLLAGLLAASVCSCCRAAVSHGALASNATAAAADADEAARRGGAGAAARTDALECGRLAPAVAARRAVAVCLFGINRSLRFTVASIRRFVLAPLETGCFRVELYAHTYSLKRTLRTSRSDEAAGLALGGAEEIRALLRPREMEVTDQAQFVRSLGALGDRLPRGSSYDGNTTRNLLCQLHSLLRVTRLWLPRAHLLHAVIYLRPDLRVLRPLDVVALAGVERAELYVPYWQCWGGLNDRFAFGRPAAAAAYGQRLLAVERFAQRQPLHAELLLRDALADAGVTPRFTASESVRVRASGQTAHMDVLLIEQRRSCTPADPRPRCAVGRCDVPAAPMARWARRAPERCAHVPEYGAPRRQVLVVLHGHEHSLRRRPTGAAINRFVLAPLRRACVSFRVAAHVRVGHGRVAGAARGAKLSATAVSRTSGLPVRDVMLAPPWRKARARQRLRTKRSAVRARATARSVPQDGALASLVARVLGRARVVVLVAIDAVIASPIDVAALFLAREGDVFVSRTTVGDNAQGCPLLAFARASSARAILDVSRYGPSPLAAGAPSSKTPLPSLVAHAISAAMPSPPEPPRRADPPRLAKRAARGWRVQPTWMRARAASGGIATTLTEAPPL
ncbi:hypothetical protein KFE25_010809 [Diacronema lutheri]|uniref:Uncharacterized protein n=1 Tax=Diacronema lutheri TaxID=2081491 RepID=A0A8J5XAY5_DIALT|nr:hypothetical protein KFE25_010809 [Diacronema lutheri]